MPPKPPSKSPITNLSQIDISKMDIADLQNIDYQKLIDGIRKKPDIVISLGIIALTFFICFNILTKSQTERTFLSNKVNEMKEKVSVLTEYKAAKEELQKFLNNLPPKITENEFLNMITDFANKNNIQIDSFAPTQNNNDPIYNLTVISLSASAQDFNDVGLFIRDIENSGANIRIDSWSGNMGGAQRNSHRMSTGNANANDPWINFQLDIVLVSFK